MEKNLIRPFSKEEIANPNRITCWSNFEDLCMRHRSFRRSPNQQESAMKPFFPIIKRMSKRYFEIFSVVFYTVGYDHQDLESYGRIYLVNFLGNPKNDKPKNEQFKLFTVYIKQRYSELASICNKKNLNILGCNDKNGLFAPIKGVETNFEAPVDCIFNNPDIFGFRMISRQEFLKKVRELGGGRRIRQKVLEGLKRISLGPRELCSFDVENTDLDHRDNFHNISPEEYFLKLEEGSPEDSTGLKRILDEMPSKERMKLLTKAFKYIRKKDMRDALRGLIESYKEAYSETTV